jgi:uncharacterized Tic20 family protein
MSDTMQPQPPETPGITEQEKTMGLVAHLLGLIGWIGPLVFWLIKKDESAYVKEQTLESLNFQITVLIAWIACVVLSVIKIGGILMPLVGLANTIFVIIAAVTSKDGVQYKYPVNLRLIK